MKEKEKEKQRGKKKGKKGTHQLLLSSTMFVVSLV
jgi:hypothetical protein